jgi:hypothetical protein
MYIRRAGNGLVRMTVVNPAVGKIKHSPNYKLGARGFFDKIDA